MHVCLGACCDTLAFGRDHVDDVLQLLRRRISISIRDGDEIHLQGEQFAFHRQFTYQELICHAKHSGFKIVARHGELDSHVDVFDQEARRLVVVLQKQIDIHAAEM